MEHVAKSLGKDATDVKMMNTYTQGAVSNVKVLVKP